jgi:hypothetical protein
MRSDRSRFHVLYALLGAVLSACSGDDASGENPCPDGGDTAPISCECEDGGVGVQSCGDDGTLEPCDCSGQSGGGAGGAGGPGSGTSGSGASGSGVSGTGGGGAPQDEDAGGGAGSGSSTGDAGTSDGGTADGGSQSGGTLPMDGEQLAVCTDEQDCDDGLGCYAEGGGQDFCTATCSNDDDCQGLGGAEYTCSDDGLCEVVCAVGDSSSCPEGMTCLQTSGPGPGGLQFRCKYSTAAGSAGGAFDPCSTGADCEDGLQCVGAFAAIPGYCTGECEDTDECTEQPSSGSIEPTCIGTTPLPASPSMCLLDCSDDADGCPDDMTCGIGGRCTYQ